MSQLTEKQQLVRWIVAEVREGHLDEEFKVAWTMGGPKFVGYSGAHQPVMLMTEGAFDALETAGLLSCSRPQKYMRRCTVTGQAYKAVDENFHVADTSFIQYLTPLAELSAFDSVLKQRCLPILGGASSDVTLH